jgi:murein DD-endopeptidase MepM/ murein hydrolase activator NlpD
LGVTVPEPHESDTDDHDDDHESRITDDMSDEDAERLLADAVDDDDDSDDDSDSADGKKKRSDKDAAATAAELAKWKQLARRHERAYKETSGKLKKYEDQNKSETERLQETAQESATRAAKAEAALRRREIAEERAPAHATLAQIKAVAKRLSGDDDEALEADADELFELLAPEPAKPRTPQRPKERMRGGGDPEEEVEETDPRKLAEMVLNYRKTR